MVFIANGSGRDYFAYRRPLLLLDLREIQANESRKSAQDRDNWRLLVSEAKAWFGFLRSHSRTIITKSLLKAACRNFKLNEVCFYTSIRITGSYGRHYNKSGFFPAPKTKNV